MERRAIRRTSVVTLMPWLDPSLTQAWISVKVERAILTLNPRIRRAVRAQTRLRVFQEEKEARKRLPRDQRGRFQPPYYGADARGRHAWASRELEEEARAARPKSRRSDKLQTDIIATVRRAIVRQLPEYEPARDIERGAPAKAHRLTTKFLRVYFPSMLAGATVHRLRNRSSLPRLKSSIKSN